MDENYAKIAVELGKCPQMAYLRQEIARRGYEYRDDSSVVDGPLHDYRHVMLRTKWTHDGEEVSVIWGYFDLDGERTWMTYGAPEMLECWYVPHDKEPVPMTVVDILRECA